MHTQELGQYTVVEKGLLRLSNTCMRKWCDKWGMSLRQRTTSAQTLPPNWEELGYIAMLRLALLVATYDIPPALVVNSDQMAQYVVPTANKLRTYYEK